MIAEAVPEEPALGARARIERSGSGMPPGPTPSGADARA